MRSKKSEGRLLYVSSKTVIRIRFVRFIFVKLKVACVVVDGSVCVAFHGSENVDFGAHGLMSRINLSEPVYWTLLAAERMRETESDAHYD